MHWTSIGCPLFTHMPEGKRRLTSDHARNVKVAFEFANIYWHVHRIPVFEKLKSPIGSVDEDPYLIAFLKLLFVA